MKKLTLAIAAVLLLGLWPMAGAQMMMHNYNYNYMRNRDTTTGNSGTRQGYSGPGYMMGQGYRGQYGMGPGMMNNGYMGYGYGMMNNGYMGYGMMNMYNMMNGMYGYNGNISMQMPMMPYYMIVNSLPGMQNQLSLTNDESNKLIQLQSNFLKREVDYRADLDRNLQKLSNMTKNDSSPDAIKKQLELCESSRVMIQSDVYDTAMKMRDLLNTSQRQQFDRLTSQYMNMFSNNIISSNSNNN